MSDDKFQILADVKVGTLDDTMQLEWARLQRAEKRLEKLQEEHSTALDAFWEAVQRQFGHHIDDLSPVTQSFSVSDAGDVFVENCTCPLCQAVLHKMTVAQTVEEMYKNDLIPHQAIDAMRARAKHIDFHREQRNKMLN